MTGCSETRKTEPSRSGVCWIFSDTCSPSLGFSSETHAFSFCKPSFSSNRVAHSTSSIASFRTPERRSYSQCKPCNPTEHFGKGVRSGHDRSLLMHARFNREKGNAAGAFVYGCLAYLLCRPGEDRLLKEASQIVLATASARPPHFFEQRNGMLLLSSLAEFAASSVATPGLKERFSALQALFSTETQHMPSARDTKPRQSGKGDGKSSVRASTANSDLAVSIASSVCDGHSGLASKSTHDSNVSKEGSMPAIVTNSSKLANSDVTSAQTVPVLVLVDCCLPMSDSLKPFKPTHPLARYPKLALPPGV